MKNQIVDKFIKALDRLKNEGPINRHCEKEIASLKSRKALGTVSKDLTSYRRAVKSDIKNENTKRLALQYLKLTNNEMLKLAAKKKLARSNQQFSQRMLTIEIMQGVVKTAIELLDSASYIKRGLGLCALTGRRPIEIFKTAKMVKVGTHLVLFEGQAKAKGTKFEGEGFLISTLCPAEKIVNALKSIRNAKDFTKKTNSQTHSIIANQMSPIAKRMFSGLLGRDVIAYDLRAFYIRVAACLYGENTGEKIPVALVMSHLAGHKEFDSNTAGHYDKFSIARSLNVSNGLCDFFTFNEFEINR